MAYKHLEIEEKWQKYWKENKSFSVTEDSNKPKFYILDMFPYPSGAGLHVGHPLGYIASDIYTRYKRLKGFNVLHPMGYDAFGLPAEQYAIQTGQHPEVTTKKNIGRYREQLDKIGLSFDWDREVQTCDPQYYKWTQWAFIQMFHSYYDVKKDKACPIDDLVHFFENHGSLNHSGFGDECPDFSKEDWSSFGEKEREDILQLFRLAYLADSPVNWCPELGTVLANDEVKEGLSVRGGHPVIQKVMQQWSLRVSAYAPRLLQSLEKLEWSESIKEIQRNWIGRSEGAEISFKVQESDLALDIYTTRPDTLFGVTFMVLAPESALVERLVTEEQRTNVDEYLEACKRKSQRERMTNVKEVSGVFTGSYAAHPFSGKPIPIWVGDYVLADYGTGAIMAVPAHDQRDYSFAKHFKIPIVPVYDGDISEQAYEDKKGKVINSDFLNGLDAKDAIGKAIEEVGKRNVGEKKINYRLRDATFSRQRYWGEPIPVYFENGIPKTLDENDLPLSLPEVDAYLPTKDGEPPLGRAQNWKGPQGQELELSTMPGFAGSSAYFLRYMDPKNDRALADKANVEYWRNVDLYIGGSEHATGHLIYSRFWNKVLFDLGHAVEDEPFKKMINQGMIQGRSNFVFRSKEDPNKFYSQGKKKGQKTQKIHVDVNIVDNDQLDMDAFKNWRPEFSEAQFITEEVDGKNVYQCAWAVEKMSKSMYNVVNPDVIVERYGADTLRLYEMFLGPIEQSKPWNTNGIEGVYRFLNKFWNLFHKDEKIEIVDEKLDDKELKILHTCIKKISSDIENFSFNTSVSAFMIALNDLGKDAAPKRELLEKFVVMLSPFAPHLAEELWLQLGHQGSVLKAEWPVWDEKFLVEDTIKYPVSFNGKTRFLLDLPSEMSKEEVEKTVLEDENTKKYIGDKQVRKVIVVPKKIVNIVIG